MKSCPECSHLLYRSGWYVKCRRFFEKMSDLHGATLCCMTLIIWTVLFELMLR